MVKPLRYRAVQKTSAWIRVADGTAIVVLLLLGCIGRTSAAQNEVHYLHQGVMPPGAIGSVQLRRGGPLNGYFQPVEIKAPKGAAISLAVGNCFDRPVTTPLRVGMLVGQVYRLRVTQIPLAEGVEVFPTIEVIDRLYTPPGQQVRFAIPLEIDVEDLRLAASGKFVTRVIYVEDPFRAVPTAQKRGRQNWYDVGPGRDPLAEADQLGRPVAILRMGARLPIDNGDAKFFFNSPPLCRYPAKVEKAPATPTPKQEAVSNDKRQQQATRPKSARQESA